MDDKKDKKDFDLICYNFSQNIIKIINESELPLTNIYYLLKDIIDEVDKERKNKIMILLQKEKTKIKESPQ